jgi:hypothetical protein
VLEEDRGDLETELQPDDLLSIMAVIDVSKIANSLAVLDFPPKCTPRLNARAPHQFFPSLSPTSKLNY